MSDYVNRYNLAYYRIYCSMYVVGLVGVVGLVNNNYDERKFAQFSLHNTAAECDF